MISKKIILVVYSAYVLVVADTAIENKLNIIGYAEKVLNISYPYQIEYLGNEMNNDFICWRLDADFLLGIRDNKFRQKIYDWIIEKVKNIYIN